MTLQEKLEKLRNHGCTEQEITEIADECLILLDCQGQAVENAYNKGYRKGVHEMSDFVAKANELITRQKAFYAGYWQSEFDARHKKMTVEKPTYQNFADSLEIAKSEVKNKREQEQNK